MAAEGLYPLVSQDGQAIPLDIVKPKSFIQWLLAVATVRSIVIPASYKTVYIFSDVDAYLKFGVADLPNAIVDATEYADTIFIPANTFMVVQVVSGDASLVSPSAGLVRMSSIVQWAALNQSLQTSFG